MRELIRVLLLPMREPPKFAEVGTELCDLQALVGGYVEAVYLDDRIVLWVNEESLLNGMHTNRPAPPSVRDRFVDGMIRGPAFISAIDRSSGEAVSLTDKDVARLPRWVHG